MEEAFPVRPVGNPMQLLSLLALHNGRSPHGIWDDFKLRQPTAWIMRKRRMCLRKD
jgi:hypothetical protein